MSFAEVKRKFLNPKRYQRKPTYVTAVKWLPGVNDDVVQAFLGEMGVVDDDIVQVRTMEGGIQAKPGDWIVKGIAGEFYAVNSELFPRLYNLDSAS